MIKRNATGPYVLFIGILFFIVLFRFTICGFILYHDVVQSLIAIISVTSAILVMWSQRIRVLRNGTKANTVDGVQKDLVVTHITLWLKKMWVLIFILSSILFIIDLLDCELLILKEIECVLFPTTLMFFFCFCLFFLDFFLEDDLLNNFRKNDDTIEHNLLFVKKVQELDDFIVSHTHEYVPKVQMGCLLDEGLFTAEEVHHYQVIKTASERLKKKGFRSIPDNYIEIADSLLRIFQQ